MKKVLGLVVSERKLGNSELLVKEILNNVPDPCTREMMRLTDFRIEPCRACYRCLEPGSRCTVRDDFNFILDKIMEADGVVIGLPVYVLGPHGYYKMLSDRLLGAGNYSARTRGKPCVLVIPYGLPGWEGYARAAALVLPGLLEMTLADVWMVHATLPGESVVNPGNIEYAGKLGQSLLGGREFKKGPRDCPKCGSDLFRLLPGGEIECPICSARGRIGAGGRPEFPASGHFRFSTGALQEHFGGWLVEMREKYLKERDILKEAQKPYRGLRWWIEKGEVGNGEIS